MMGCMDAVHASGTWDDRPDDVGPADAATPAERMAWLSAHRLRLVDEFDQRTAAIALADAQRALDVALDRLADLDPGRFDAAECRAWLGGIEHARRRVEAASVAAAGHVERHNPFRDQGFFSARTALKHMLSLSGAETYRRLQTARMHERLDDWARAEHDGVVGVAQSELMGRVAANPRVSCDVLERDQSLLLDDARTLPYDEFEHRIRTWESLADPVGARADNERQRAQRDVMLRGRPEGGWTLTGSLTELAGAEFMEILGWYVEAEWETDWAEARARVGAEATTADLQRTEPQRRADALLAMARAAASARPGRRPSAITVNVLIDETTLEARLRGEQRDPADYRTIVCRTQSGRRLHPDDVVNAALVERVRRAVYDSSSTVIDLGRRSRVFRGAARDAAMLLATECAWIGCDRPVDWCDADHSTGWKAHGASVPRNAGPLCGAHNRLKERGFQVFRDDCGDWHTIDPDGHEIS